MCVCVERNKASLITRFIVVHNAAGFHQLFNDIKCAARKLFLGQHDLSHPAVVPSKRYLFRNTLSDFLERVHLSKEFGPGYANWSICPNISRLRQNLTRPLETVQDVLIFCMCWNKEQKKQSDGNDLICVKTLGNNYSMINMLWIKCYEKS